MARGFTWQDILGIGNLTGNPDPIWGSLSGQNAIKDATGAQQAALAKAFDAIQGYADKSVALQQPYTQNAGADFNRQRGLVQGGYYQTPYAQSFQPQQQKQQGFSFNPGQGSASFMSQQGLLNSFTPQGLPSQAGYNTPPPPSMSMRPNPQASQTPTAGPGQNPSAGVQQALQVLMRQNPAPGMSATPMANNQGAMQANPMFGYNPQTGQGNPLVSAGVKPADPKIPDPQTLMTLKMKFPWMFGQSGPLEGGMPGRGLI